MIVLGPYRKPDWDAPPPVAAGEITAVDFHALNALAVAHHVQPCQACSASVQINKEHVLAMIRVERNRGSGFEKARFCNRQCWIDWAGDPE